MIPNNKQRLVKIKELSEITSIPRYTLRKWAKQKKIPGYKMDSTYIFDLNEVIDAIKENGKID